MKKIGSFKKGIVLLVVAGLIIGFAGYLSHTQPGGMDKSYLNYNSGVEAQLKNDVEGALAWYGQVAAEAENPKVKSLAFYNIGTIWGTLVFNENLTAESRLQIAQYAIENLREAVRNDPDNLEAKYNLEILVNKQIEISKEVQQGGEGEPAPGPGYSPGKEGGGY